jgi:hypothetical protein
MLILSSCTAQKKAVKVQKKAPVKQVEEEEEEEEGEEGDEEDEEEEEEEAAAKPAVAEVSSRLGGAVSHPGYVAGRLVLTLHLRADWTQGLPIATQSSGKVHL